MNNLRSKRLNYRVSSFIVFTLLLLLAATAFGQEPVDSAQNRAGDIGIIKNDRPDSGTSPTTKATPLTFSKFPKRTEISVFPRPVQSGDDEWQLEIRPYAWLAGIYGTLRVGNLTADTTQDSGNVLGMLDFAAAAQIEAVKGRWRLMFDENYVNLGTTASGPLGISSIEVEPTLNIFEFGGSYTLVSVPNKNATSADSLPPSFSAEVLGGGRYVRFRLELEPANAATEEGSRNLFGFFVGNRFKFSPHPKVSLIGKYSVGTSGVGSNLAWSADALADFRVKKSFSIGGGYRWLGLDANNPDNRIGFDGTLRGIMLSLTLHR